MTPITFDQLMQEARVIAMRNGGRLTRQSNGRWRGDEKSQAVPAEIVWALLQSQHLSVVSKKNGDKGYATVVEIT